MNTGALGLRFSEHDAPASSSVAAIKQEDEDSTFNQFINDDQCAEHSMSDQHSSFPMSTGLPAYYPQPAFYPQPNYFPAMPALYPTYTSDNSDSTSSSNRLQGSGSPESSVLPSVLEAGDPRPTLLILGIPDEGTRTRVETQIRITLMLLQPLTHDNVRLTTPAGQLLPSVRDHAVKLAQWKHLKLPSYTAIKRKQKKYLKTDVVPEDTLYLECQVLRTQEPREVFICSNCSERERKRTQRKKDARLKPTEEMETDTSNTTTNADSTDYDRRKILLFNCGEYLDFESGEVTIPCRIACYCRHHKEREGFEIALQVKDHLGNLIASTVSPRIFTTDDHKAKARPRPGYSGESSANVSRDTSFEDLSTLLEQGIQTVGKHAKKPSLASQRTRSSASLAEEGHSDSTSRGRARADKPYERRRRSGSLTRTSMFSMTPLDGRSRRNSPESPNVPLPPGTIINNIPSDLLPPTDPYSIPPASPAYSITTSLNDAFSAQSFMPTSPPIDAYDNTRLGMNLNASPLMNQFPEISRVVPAEGSLSGGYQVTVLGRNFTPDAICRFGPIEAISAQFFSDTTLICSVPPGMGPGPVPVTVQTSNFPSASSSCTFTYVATDQSILEIALQIVGFKLTGRYDNARSVAQQIIDANAPQHDPSPMVSGMSMQPYMGMQRSRKKLQTGLTARLKQLIATPALASGHLITCIS